MNPCPKCGDSGLIATGWHIYPVTRTMKACDCVVGRHMAMQTQAMQGTTNEPAQTR